MILVERILKKNGIQALLCIKCFNLPHIIINPSDGFISRKNEHTNDIGKFMSHLKARIKKKNMVKRQNIDIWLPCYKSERRYLINYNTNGFQDCY
ncbi:hypothetical protein SLOPH_708 [Spraguea lophii 42_110]|uniref:Uncharacterized protein n=1 Tax=Spraguea lophii (strain 42_110) TaxID=1358809 RepID=S7W9T6_SPRLO|nr:hypothetical protein SLOPH_708 [Spraguea lophii 42_110]